MKGCQVLERELDFSVFEKSKQNCVKNQAFLKFCYKVKVFVPLEFSVLIQP